MAATALEPDWNRPEPATEAERRDGLRRIQPLLHALGITTVADPWATAETVRTYREAHAAGELVLRVSAMPYDEGLRDHLTTPDEVIARVGGLGVGSGFGDGRLSLGALKVYIDGEGKRSQALREAPWPATGEHGILAISPDELERVALFCAQTGWALGVHAIGGRAQRIALEAFERVDAHVPLAARRFRLIHAYLEPTRETMERAARLGVAVSSQPAIQWQNGVWLRDALGEAASEANPLRSVAGCRGTRGTGVGWPLFPVRPAPRAVVRTHARRTRRGRPLGPAQRISADEALRAATRDAAWAAFADDRGMLAPGMTADWAELDVDPVTCSDAALASASVRRTVVGGSVVFRA